MSDQDKPLPIRSDQDPIAFMAHASFMKLSNYDKVVPVFAYPLTTFNYFEGTAQVGEVRLTFVNSLSWSFELEAFLNNDSGDILQDDDDTRLTLE